MTEGQARNRLGSVKTFTSDFRAMKNVLAGRNERSLYKLVVDGATDEIVGIHMIGPDAPEILQAAAIAVKAQAQEGGFRCHGCASSDHGRRACADAMNDLRAKLDARCLESFERQGMMQLIGAKLVEAADGRAASSKFRIGSDLTQQNGYFHGGVVAAIADTASGYAAYTTMPADASVLTVEFKINLVNPAAGERLRAEAKVRKVRSDAGRRGCHRHGRCAAKPRFALRRNARDLHRPAQDERRRATPRLPLERSEAIQRWTPRPSV